LPLIERWKILDNLRRSLTSPALVLVLVSAWTFLPGSALAWTVAAVLAFISPQWPALLGPPRKLGEAGARALLALTFAAHQATAAVDAIVRVAVRTAITRRRLLEWTSAAHTAAGLRGRSLRATLWRDMVGSPLIACAIGVALARLAPTSLASAAPLLALWLLAPEIARWVSLPKPPSAAARAQDLVLLRDLRRPGGPVAADRQLPGGAARADSTPHVSDEHRDDAGVDAVGVRLRLSRPERALAAAA
jgi:cyclic beta-1,2-glucan synthetase